MKLQIFVGIYSLLSIYSQLSEGQKKLSDDYENPFSLKALLDIYEIINDGSNIAGVAEKSKTNKLGNFVRDSDYELEASSSKLKYRDSAGTRKTYDDLVTSASSYGGCCGGSDITQVLAILALGLALLYLITVFTTTTAGGRRKRNVKGSDIDDPDVTLDGPAWLSMIHELWQQDAVADNPYCAYETLCRMNRIAAESGGQGTWAAHLSSVPLSYLLHNRHEYGFQGYMNAALMGKAGANCTELYSGCSRLN